MVEISGGEVLVPLGREPPRAIIEALAGDVDIVAVEHAVDEPRGDIGGGQRRRSRSPTSVEQRAAGSSPRLAVEMLAGNSASAPRCPSASSKKASRWKVPMRIWPWLSRVSTAERVGEGSSPRCSSSPVSNKAKRLRGVDPERLEHLGRQHLAHPALERQPPVAEPAVRRLARCPWCRGRAGGPRHRATGRTGSRGRRRCRDCSGGTGGRGSAARAARRGCRAAARSARNAAPSPRHRAPARPARRPAPVEEARDRLGKARRRRPRRKMPAPSVEDRRIGAIGLREPWPRDRGARDHGESVDGRHGPTAIGTAPTASSFTIATMPATADRPPILCLPGLTRNAARFRAGRRPLRRRVAGDRGRLARPRRQARSTPIPANYAPPTYVADLLKLLDQLGIADAVFVGTSLGGL